MKWKIIHSCLKPPTRYPLVTKHGKWKSTISIHHHLMFPSSKSPFLGDFPAVWFLEGISTNIPSGCWLSHPSEKYESQLGLFSQYMENKIHIPNHQPAINIPWISHYITSYSILRAFECFEHICAMVKTWYIVCSHPSYEHVNSKIMDI